MNFLAGGEIEETEEGGGAEGREEEGEIARETGFDAGGFLIEEDKEEETEGLDKTDGFVAVDFLGIGCENKMYNN